MMEVLIVGAGAQAKQVCEIWRLRGDFELVGALDIMGNPDIIGKDIGGAKIIGGLDFLDSYEPTPDRRVFIAASSNKRKQELAEQLEGRGYQFYTGIHPSAVISDTAQISEGALINPLVIIQPFARIGRHVVVHAGSIVEHDCVLDDFTILAPAVALAGWVKVGRRANLYTNCSVIPAKSIGDDAVVGAGAVVIEDVPAGKVVAGSPARVLRDVT